MTSASSPDTCDQQTSICNAVTGITVSSTGNILVIEGNRVRKIVPGGGVSTIAGKADSFGVVAGSLPGSLTAPSGITLLPNAQGTSIAVRDEGAILVITE